MENTHALVGLNLVSGLGSVKINRLIGKFGSAQDVFSAGPEHTALVEGIGAEIAAGISKITPSMIEDELYLAQRSGARVVTLEHPDYPAALKNIYDPPPVLYMTGEAVPECAINVGVVGTRNATDYTARFLKDMAKEMGREPEKYVITSGMARGADCIAHHEASVNGVFTAAVLGFGLSRVYPYERHYMAGEIIKKGCLISEFPMRMLGLKQNFPRRNRVISGIADCILVTEAPEKSGALITADFALEQGREIFAVPGSVYSDKSRGTNALIKQGAKPATSLNDITEAFGFKTTKRPALPQADHAPLSADEEKVLSLLGQEKKHIDNISFESNINVFKTASTLTILEMKGLVKQLGGMNFVRV